MSSLGRILDRIFHYLHLIFGISHAKALCHYLAGHCSHHKEGWSRKPIVFAFPDYADGYPTLIANIYPKGFFSPKRHGGFLRSTIQTIIPTFHAASSKKSGTSATTHYVRWVLDALRVDLFVSHYVRALIKLVNEMERQGNVLENISRPST